jgi:hypothetical protein
LQIPVEKKPPHAKAATAFLSLHTGSVDAEAGMVAKITSNRVDADRQCCLTALGRR